MEGASLEEVLRGDTIWIWTLLLVAQFLMLLMTAWKGRLDVSLEESQSEHRSAPECVFWAL